MNVNFGQNLARMAMQNFMAMGNMMTQGANVLRSPIFSQFQAMSANSFGMGAAGGFAFAGVFSGNQMNPGFLAPPMGQPAGFAQMANGMMGMQQPWNAMGQMMNGGMPQGMMGMANPQQMMGQLMGMMQNIANMMNMMRPQMNMMNQLNNAKQANAMNMGRPMAQQPGAPMAQPGVGQPGAPKLPGTGANFPAQAASDFLNTLPKSANGVAKSLNVSGRKDVQRINDAVKMLKTAKPKISVGGNAPAKAGLSLSAQDVEAIRAAKTPQEAKSIVMKAIGDRKSVV